MKVQVTRLAFLRVGLAALVFLTFTRSAVSEDPGPAGEESAISRDAAELRETARMIQGELPRWQITVGDGQTELKLQPNPVLRWTNPATGRIYGDIYVWTSDGRPEAVMSLYKGWQPAWGFAGEFHSLSLTKIIGRRNQSVVWKCDQPGIELRDVLEAPAVAETPRRRLQQMRALAADFSAVLIDRRYNRDGERQALRLLTNPIFRYASPERAVAAGAMFAFVVGTDVEALLLLEARGAEKETRWQYALARMNRDELAAFYKEQEVWRVAPGTWGERNKPYFLMALSEPPAPE